MVKVNYQGRDVEGIDVSFKVDREEWNDYQLADGTELRMRLIVTDIVMIPEEWDSSGNPVYVAKSQNIMVAKCPDTSNGPPLEYFAFIGAMNPGALLIRSPTLNHQRNQE